MCTLILDFAPTRERPYLVAANRDEVLSRPSTDPRRWSGEPFVAPRDEHAGGTWLGLNVHGLFVAITNRFGSVNDAARESRGTLVLEALRHTSAAALHATMAKLSAARFNPFHLLYTDGRDAFVSWSPGNVMQQQALEPGLHIVTERSLGGDDRSRTELIRGEWPRLTRDAGLPTHGALHQLLSTHGPEGHGVCMHLPQYNYGTRSSLILFGSTQAPLCQWWWADASPCLSPHLPRPELSAELG